jgi:hypothetical protein
LPDEKGEGMQCNCGGETIEHTIVRNKLVVCEYQKCKACGRQHITSGEYPIEPEDKT